MALMVLDNDITNAHHIEDHAILDVVRDFAVTRVGGHEAQAIYKCHREEDEGRKAHSFHIVTAIPGDGHDAAEDAREKTRKEGAA